MNAEDGPEAASLSARAAGGDMDASGVLAAFNRDGRINALDLGIVKQNLGRTIPLLATPIPAEPVQVVFAPGLFSDGNGSSTRRLPTSSWPDHLVKVLDCHAPDPPPVFSRVATTAASRVAIGAEHGGSVGVYRACSPVIYAAGRAIMRETARGLF